MNCGLATQSKAGAARNYSTCRHIGRDVQRNDLVCPWHCACVHACRRRADCHLCRRLLLGPGAGAAARARRGQHALGVHSGAQGEGARFKLQLQQMHVVYLLKCTSHCEVNEAVVAMVVPLAVEARAFVVPARGACSLVIQNCDGTRTLPSLDHALLTAAHVSASTSCERIKEAHLPLCCRVALHAHALAFKHIALPRNSLRTRRSAPAAAGTRRLCRCTTTPSRSPSRSCCRSSLPASTPHR
jgi:hypothetical protein